MFFVCCCRGSINERQQSARSASRGVPPTNRATGPNATRHAARVRASGHVNSSRVSSGTRPSRKHCRHRGCAAYGVLQRVQRCRIFVIDLLHCRWECLQAQRLQLRSGSSMRHEGVRAT